MRFAFPSHRFLTYAVVFLISGLVIFSECVDVIEAKTPKACTIEIQSTHGKTLSWCASDLAVAETYQNRVFLCRCMPKSVK